MVVSPKAQIIHWEPEELSETKWFQQHRMISKTDNPWTHPGIGQKIVPPRGGVGYMTKKVFPPENLLIHVVTTFSFV